MLLRRVALTLTAALASGEAPTCGPRLETAIDEVLQALRAVGDAEALPGLRRLPSAWSESAPAVATCAQAHSKLPRRTEFFSRVAQPKDVPAQHFPNMLASSGIHPRGVILNSEFYELPLRFDAAVLAAEVEALITDDVEGWERPTAENVEQGVVSSHFRLTVSSQGTEQLDGPYEEAKERLSSNSSKYLQHVLHSLGSSVIGNTALMSLPPGGFVEPHFDTNQYWYPRVRVHIPVSTNPQVSFTCGARGGEQTINMQAGRAYVFDNHLAHSVKNDGTAPRVHLTVDLVGSREFWGMVAGSRLIGSEPRDFKVTPRHISAEAEYDRGPLAIEAWSDKALFQDFQAGSCMESVEALNTTAWPLFVAGREADRHARELLAIGEAWCKRASDTVGDNVAAEAGTCSAVGRLSRPEAVQLLQRLVAMWDCREAEDGNRQIARGVSDALAEMHRIVEADAELRFLGFSRE